MMTRLKYTLAMLPLLLSTIIAASYIPREFHVRSSEASIDLNTEKVAIVLGLVNPLAAEIFHTQVLSTIKNSGDRLILISSPGGHEASGAEIIADIEAEKSTGTRIVCVVSGQAASMAFNILTHCDVRLAESSAILMFHKLSLGRVDEADGERNTPKKLRRLADTLDEDDKAYSVPNRKALKMSAKDYNIYADNDHIWKADALVARKYLHGIAVFVK